MIKVVIPCSGAQDALPCGYAGKMRESECRVAADSCNDDTSVAMSGKGAIVDPDGPPLTPSASEFLR